MRKIITTSERDFIGNLPEILKSAVLLFLLVMNNLVALRFGIFFHIPLFLYLCYLAWFSGSGFIKILRMILLLSGLGSLHILAGILAPNLDTGKIFIFMIRTVNAILILVITSEVMSRIDLYLMIKRSESLKLVFITGIFILDFIRIFLKKIRYSLYVLDKKSRSRFKLRGIIFREAAKSARDLCAARYSMFMRESN